MKAEMNWHGYGCNAINKTECQTTGWDRVGVLLEGARLAYSEANGRRRSFVGIVVKNTYSEGGLEMRRSMYDGWGQAIASDGNRRREGA